MVGEHAHGLELGVVEQVRSSITRRGCGRVSTCSVASASAGLWHQGGVVGERALAERSQAMNDSLVETIETDLNRCRDATRIAVEPHGIPSTPHYRLGRIETINGVDLHDGWHRLALHLRVKFRFLDAYQNAPTGPAPPP